VAATSLPAHPERLRYLDGIRAVAILAVIADHIAWHMPGLARASFLPLSFSNASVAFGHLMLEGAHGVDLFFVVSGFCLSYPFLKRYYAGGTTGFSAANFFSKRIVRILPPYYVALAFFGLAEVFRHKAQLQDVLAQSVFWNPSGTVVNETFWTLGIEFRWYLLFPLLLFVWLRARPLFWAILGTAALATLSIASRTPDVAALPGFMLGIVAAEIGLKKSRVANHAPALFCLAVAAAFAAEPFYGRVFGAQRSVSFLPLQITWQLAAFCFVIAAGASRRLGALLSASAFVAVGTISYSLYLTHAPVVVAIDSIAQRIGIPATVALVAIAVGAFGLQFFRLFEKPFLSGEARRRLHLALEGGLLATFDRRKPKAEPARVPAA
jgi:peptidoglycan/LPS O-acetylase OafA/YrhL